MNAFVSGLNASGNVLASRTYNGAKTNSTSGHPLVDFFSLAGAARKMSDNDFVSIFANAYGFDKALALRTALWLRDVRGGAGERESFRRVLRWLDSNDTEALARVLPRVPELGRWDDLLVVQSPLARAIAVRLIAQALVDGNGLCAKWMPRKGPEAAKLRMELGLTPKQYRKTLVNLTNVVETPMCANEWNSIDLEKIPSVASARYRKAFKKRMPEKFTSYATAVAKGEAKVNAGAIFPHDVIKALRASSSYWNYNLTNDKDIIDVTNAQWDALPDFVGNGSFLPIIDVSGSMYEEISKGTMCIDISTALGIYCAERNKSAFKDVWLTFSNQPKLQKLSGKLSQKLTQIMGNKNNGYDTNIDRAFDAILDHARANNVPAEDMPENLLIISDMEFNNSSFRGNDITAVRSAQARFEAAGYRCPKIVFWRVNARLGNQPVTFREDGTALISGFSPAVMKGVLAQKNLDPLDMALETIMQDRYALAD